MKDRLAEQLAKGINRWENISPSEGVEKTPGQRILNVEADLLEPLVR